MRYVHASRLLLLSLAAILAARPGLCDDDAAARARGKPAASAAVKLPQLPDDCWGVYSWCSWNPGRIRRDNCPNIVGVPIILHWKSLEPEDGQLRFDELLGQRLKLARKNGFYAFTMVWVGPASPEWIYTKGVPRVKTDRKDWTFPYYFHADYKRYFHRLVRAFGRYVCALPDELRERIIFVQVCEGSTGDGYCYKGRPLDRRYAISREQWSSFRVKTWDVFKQAFQDGARPPVRLLVNADSSRTEQHDWLMKNQISFGCKQGMFSHGYHISDGRSRLAAWGALLARAEKAGKHVFTRGEMDAEWQRSGWSRRNLAQSLYWSALYATHCGLDLWNVPADACEGHTYAPAIAFFNKYAGKRNPAASPAAFCALRRGLDAADTEAFPEDRFGKAHRRNIDRYVKIARAFAARGAIQGDPPAAVGGGMANRSRKDYNDVGWGILRGNYRRFLEQVDPDRTSVGCWHVGPTEHHFSRFARSFDHAAGKKAMYFRLDKRFFADPNKPRRAHVRVAYLDKGRGRWALIWCGPDGPKTAFTVHCGDTGKWREKQAVLDGARFNGALPGRSDLMLQYLDGHDTVFHIVELDRNRGHLKKRHEKHP